MFAARVCEKYRGGGEIYVKLPPIDNHKSVDVSMTNGSSRTRTSRERFTRFGRGGICRLFRALYENKPAPTLYMLR